MYVAYFCVYVKSTILDYIMYTILVNDSLKEVCLYKLDVKNDNGQLLLSSNHVINHRLLLVFYTSEIYTPKYNVLNSDRGEFYRYHLKFLLNIFIIEID